MAATLPRTVDADVCAALRALANAEREIANCREHLRLDRGGDRVHQARRSARIAAAEVAAALARTGDLVIIIEAANSTTRYSA